MERQEGQDIPLPPDGDKFPGVATDLLLRPVQNPLLSSTAHTDENSTDLTPLTISEQFSLHAPPSTGYVPGCYLPSPPRPLLPPLGHFTTSANGAYTHTSWTSYPGASTFGTGHPPPPFSTPYASFPNLFGANYNTLPPAVPLSHHHHPEPDSSLSSPAVHCRKRRRGEEELVARSDLNVPANISGAALAELPTPPDSSSDRSDSPPDCYRALHSTARLSHPFPSPPLPQNGVHVSIAPKSEDLWSLFYAANTEMIVTKNGRCLFPVLMFNVSGLSRKKEYNVYVRAVNNDQYRYKYLHNAWTQVSESEYTHDKTRMIAKHPNSPQSGTKWMGKDVDFKSVKITHYSKSKHGDILLNTMHKYFFEIVVEEHRSDSEPLVFPFHLTQFVAVTAYQSAKLTELKKEKNPFARGVKHHDSETDSPQIHPIYHTGFSHPYVGYNVPLYQSSSDALSVPYPTPWNHTNSDT